MKQPFTFFLSFIIILSVAFFTSFAIAADEPAPDGIEKPDKDGFYSLFNGKDLEGWDGDPEIWSVKDGCIVGQTEAEGPKKLTYNTFLILKDKEYSDFVLKFDIKLSKDGNSGVQYRSWLNKDPNKKWSVLGYQADFDGTHTYSGILYGEGFRGILANRGQESEIGDDHTPKMVKEFAKNEDIKKLIKLEDWNEYEVTAKDFTFTHKINDKLMSICTDNDKEQRKEKGIIAIQAHVGPPMKVEIRNIRIRPLTK